MPKEPELKARDKVVLRMTREGAVEENLTAGSERRVSKRLDDAELVKPAETAAPSEALSPEEQKKVQMRRQQRQFQAEMCIRDSFKMGKTIGAVSFLQILAPELNDRMLADFLEMDSNITVNRCV